MRLLHAADLHLDSPFRGLSEVSPRAAARLRAATWRMLDNLGRAARRHEVDCLLLAGDTYDSADRSVLAQVRLRDALAGLARDGIETLMVLGNHDPADGWSLRLDAPGVYTFPAGTPAGRDVIVEGRTVGHVDGISYPTREVRANYAARLRRTDSAPASVALLHANVHGGVEADNDYAPANLSDLTASGHDYWALGHVHTRQELRRTGPAVVYPGNPQGRSIREDGERGAYVVEVADGAVGRLEFVPLCDVRFERSRVDVAGAVADGDLADLLEAHMDDLRRSLDGRAAVIRIELVGEAPGPVSGLLADAQHRRDLAAHLQARAEGGDLEALVWPERVVDLTSAPVPEAPPGTLLADVRELADRLAAADGDGDERLRLLGEARSVLAPLFAQPAARAVLAGAADDAALTRWAAAAAQRLARDLAGGRRR